MTTPKIPVTNLSAVSIIFRASNPEEIFIETKDMGYPVKAFQGKLCPIGGNWIGKSAKADRNPLDTVRRELDEELCLTSATASTLELSLLGMNPAQAFYLVPKIEKIVSEVDAQSLELLKTAIQQQCTPFGDFRNEIPKSVLDVADLMNTRPGFTVISSYWTVALEESEWSSLAQLQRTYGNLSNESITTLTSLPEIIESGIHTAFGHDQVLKAFFLAMGYEAARNFPLVAGITSEPLGASMATYQDYLEKYDVARKP